ncbi:uncharacterized protein DFL_004277 [Arthrobotrys flagrans]|nr:hypothetical protein DFL_004277 [Arthrobotrys flagrans]
MLSHAPVTSRIKLSDLKDATADREAHVGAVNPLPEEARTKRAVMSQFNDINDFFDTTNAALNPPPPKIASHILTPNLEKITFSRLYPTPMARCFEDKGKYVYGTLSDLREVSDYYCTIFDANMYKLVRGISLNDLGEFSLGTIYKAVKLDGGRTMRVNFQFIYQPKGYEAGQFWYPTSMFTGIQGVCHRMMRNFLSVSTAMPGCIGGSGTDTRGGWMGMDLGDRIDDRMVFRWAIDPYVRKSKEHDLPDPFPESERNNGLPRTDPKDVYQP